MGHKSWGQEVVIFRQSVANFENGPWCIAQNFVFLEANFLTGSNLGGNCPLATTPLQGGVNAA